MRTFSPAHRLDLMKALLIKVQGFTLLEMAVVLVIIGLLLGGLLMPLAAQIDQRNHNETEKSLNEIKEALIGYAMSHSAADGHPYFPCPDTNGNGVEDRPAATPNLCTSVEGDLPWVDLGLGHHDSWGDRFLYRVTQTFADNVTGFTLASVGTINIKNRGDDPITAGAVETKFLLNVATGVPVVIISHGKNRLSATDAFSMPAILMPVAPASSDEFLNATIGTTKIARTPTPPSNPCNDTVEASPYCEFDDIVAWISPNILFNRMVIAGKLP